MQIFRKHGLLIMLILFAASCSRRIDHKKQEITTFTFSTFRWTFRGATDTLFFRLLSYLETDSNGHYRLMRRDSFDDPPLYASGMMQDTLVRKVHALLSGRMDARITWHLMEGYIYNGPGYAIDYQMSGERSFIKFIPPQLPPKIHSLFASLVCLTDTASIGNWENPDLSAYQEWLKGQTEPPPIHMRPITKFKPPESD